MAEVFICPTGALTRQAVKDLRKAGICVVETDAPERCQFIRSSEVVSGDDMLWAALSALKVRGEYGNVGTTQRETLALRLFEIVNERRLKDVGVNLDDYRKDTSAKAAK
jgi:hypothetical protein